MKKSVLLGIAAVALFAIPAFADPGSKKFEGWQGYWTWTPQLIKEFPVKMKIPWIVHIVNEKDWVLWLKQIECGGDKYCFEGCKALEIACNFNLTLKCEVRNTVMSGEWSCWYQNPGPDIDMTTGGTTDVCVNVKKASLLDAALKSQAGKEIQVATLAVMCVPR